MKKETEQYKTTDLGEAAALQALGFRFAGLEDVEMRPGQKLFVFDDEQMPPSWWDGEVRPKTNIERTAERYRNDVIMLNAYDYFLAIRELKSRIFDSKRR